MKRTQVQLPETLYKKLKERATKEETSLADILRKAGEYYLSLHPETNREAVEWQVPTPEQLGEFLKPEEEWRLLGSEGESLP